MVGELVEGEGAAGVSGAGVSAGVKASGGREGAGGEGQRAGAGAAEMEEDATRRCGSKRALRKSPTNARDAQVWQKRCN